MSSFHNPEDPKNPEPIRTTPDIEAKETAFEVASLRFTLTNDLSPTPKHSIDYEHLESMAESVSRLDIFLDQLHEGIPKEYALEALRLIRRDTLDDLLQLDPSVSQDFHNLYSIEPREGDSYSPSLNQKEREALLSSPSIRGTSQIIAITQELESRLKRHYKFVESGEVSANTFAPFGIFHQAKEFENVMFSPSQIGLVCDDELFINKFADAPTQTFLAHYPSGASIFLQRPEEDLTRDFAQVGKWSRFSAPGTSLVLGAAAAHVEGLLDSLEVYGKAGDSRRWTAASNQIRKITGPLLLEKMHLEFTQSARDLKDLFSANPIPGSCQGHSSGHILKSMSEYSKHLKNAVKAFDYQIIRATFEETDANDFFSKVQNNLERELERRFTALAKTLRGASLLEPSALESAFAMTVILPPSEYGQIDQYLSSKYGCLNYRNAVDSALIELANL